VPKVAKGVTDVVTSSGVGPAVVPPVWPVQPAAAMMTTTKPPSL
jgi:hypothetical protein